MGSTPEALATAIGARAPQVARIGLETGPLCTWHWHALRALGLPVVCLDARHAKAALSVQLNKTDANDAYGPVKSLDSHRLRTLLSSRAQLVNMRRDLGTKIRGVLKTFGKVVGKVGDRGFEARVRELATREARLEESVSALLAVRARLEQQIEALETRILSFARRSNLCRRLMTIPGVGALTAVSFVTAVDDPVRFNRSSGVGAYFGLTPRRHQSGEVDRDGKVSSSATRSRLV